MDDQRPNRGRGTPPPLTSSEREGEPAWHENIFKSEPAIVLFRMVLIFVFIITEVMDPFIRVIQPEEMWLYRYPIAETSFLEEFGGSRFKALLGPMAMIFYPFVLIAFTCYKNSVNPSEVRQAIYAFLLTCPLTGIVVNIIKVFVGRPRPDFLARCYGPYYLKYTDMSRPCTGDDSFFVDGRKSFPSGHTALAACCFGFMALYSAGQMGTFHQRTKYRFTSVVVTLPLLIMPVLVGVARTCDYKHHWQDVSVGGILGLSIAYLCYRVHFPALTHEQSNMSYDALEEISKVRVSPSSSIHQVYRGNHATFTTSEDENGGYVSQPNGRHRQRPYPTTK